ncbi:hypothetical protein B738_05347 [Photorhabdus temperata subsp. temperata M1021]|nr:hypothetical protein B738_05347 [Photorhabdus temperata subsp. temperata M1021]
MQNRVVPALRYGTIGKINPFLCSFFSAPFGKSNVEYYVVDMNNVATFLLKQVLMRLVPASCGW